jgi:hypothetical protein
MRQHKEAILPPPGKPFRKLQLNSTSKFCTPLGAVVTAACKIAKAGTVLQNCLKFRNRHPYKNSSSDLPQIDTILILTTRLCIGLIIAVNLIMRKQMILKTVTQSVLQLAITACFILASSSSLLAAEYQSLASIRMQAESFISSYPYQSPQAGFEAAP